jgi:pimeloyl-ACP methyl ester carboxylesterase
LFVREVKGGAEPGRPILLIHGARVPGLASFDLDVPRGSLAADLARRGFDVLSKELVHPNVRVVVIPQATRFVHLDRPEHGRSQLLHEVRGFVQGGK